VVAAMGKCRFGVSAMVAVKNISAKGAAKGVLEFLNYFPHFGIYVM